MRAAADIARAQLSAPMLSVTSSSPDTERSHDRPDPPQLTPRAIDRIFRLWRRQFIHKFKEQADDPKSRDTWLFSLRELGITDALVRKGLLRSLSLAWPPVVGEFAELCRAGDWPDERTAMLEAVRWAVARKPAAEWEWSHPAVAAAAVSVGDWNLRLLPDSDLRRIWAHSYAVVRDRARRGEAITPPPRALPPKSEVGVITPEGRARGLRMFEEARRRYFGR